MSLKADLEALATTKPRNFDQWLEWADPEDVELVMNAIHSNTPPNRLSIALRNNEVPISRETIVKLRDAGR